MTVTARLLIFSALIVVATAAGAQNTKPSPVGAASKKAGQTFKECRNCPEMVVMPPARS